MEKLDTALIDNVQHIWIYEELKQLLPFLKQIFDVIGFDGGLDVGEVKRMLKPSQSFPDVGILRIEVRENCYGNSHNIGDGAIVLKFRGSFHSGFRIKTAIMEGSADEKEALYFLKIAYNVVMENKERLELEKELRLVGGEGKMLDLLSGFIGQTRRSTGILGED